MNVVVLTVWLSNVLSFAWGMCCLFRRPQALTREAHLVAAFGLAFSVWDGVAVARSAVGVIGAVAGITLLLLSLSLFWWAAGTCASRPLSAIGQQDAPVHLLRSGPYGLIRHPFYASYMLFWVAGCCASASRVAFGAAAVMLCAYLRAIRYEERKFARGALSGAYQEYRRTTGMLMPWLLTGSARERATGRLRRAAGSVRSRHA